MKEEDGNFSDNSRDDDLHHRGSDPMAPWELPYWQVGNYASDSNSQTQLLASNGEQIKAMALNIQSLGSHSETNNGLASSQGSSLYPPTKDGSKGHMPPIQTGFASSSSSNPFTASGQFCMGEPTISSFIDVNTCKDDPDVGSEAVTPVYARATQSRTTLHDVLSAQHKKEQDLFTRQETKSLLADNRNTARMYTSTALVSIEDSKKTQTQFGSPSSSVLNSLPAPSTSTSSTHGLDGRPVPGSALSSIPADMLEPRSIEEMLASSKKPREPQQK